MTETLLYRTFCF